MDRHDYCEFDHSTLSPRRGMTSIEARKFLEDAVPCQKTWTCLATWGIPKMESLSRIPVSTCESGAIGSWSWNRIASPYPFMGYALEPSSGVPRLSMWVGLIRIKGPDTDFMLFSFLSSTGTVGHIYMASTSDLAAIARFAADTEAHLAEGKKIHVNVIGGPDIFLDPDADETIFLPADTRADIEKQVYAFFRNPDVFRKHGILHRRGFLFVGPPGTGKTMMVRQLIRNCWREFAPAVTLIRATKRTDEHSLDFAFHQVPNDKPAMVVLEDMDSLTEETGVTRSTLLSMLDGLQPNTGLLILGTTNNPEDIDPALIHRPSRFDRVWHFDLPDLALRMQYIRRAFKSIGEDLVTTLAETTQNWSYAYLNELKTTAAMLSVDNGREQIDAEVAMKAHGLLAAQFKSGQKNHSIHRSSGVGFAA